MKKFKQYYNESSSYYEIGHKVGKPAILWIYHDNQIKTVKVKDAEASTHEELWPDIGDQVQWAGRYDPIKKTVSVAKLWAPFIPPPDKLIRRLHDTFGGDVKIYADNQIYEGWKDVAAAGLVGAASLLPNQIQAKPKEMPVKQSIELKATAPKVEDKKLTDEQYDEIMKNLNSYDYINKRFESQESLKGNARILEAVATEYGLDDLQKKLLFSMRIMENGRRGCEFGVDDYNLKSNSRRYAPERVGIDVSTPEGQKKWDEKYKSLSLKVQAQYAAGTIKKRLPIDAKGKPHIAALAFRYCPENWLSWTNKVINFLATK